MVPSGFFHGIEILPLEVLDHSQLRGLPVGELPNDSGHLFQSRHPGGTPAPFPRHQLIPAAGQRPYQQGLQHAVLSDGGGQVAQRSLVELLAGLIPVGLDLQQTQGYRLALFLHRVLGKQGLQPLAQSAFLGRHLRSPPLFPYCPTGLIPASSRARASYAAAPLEPRS